MFWLRHYGSPLKECSFNRAPAWLWENAWSGFVPFRDCDVEIRRVICSTNAIESVNARYRRAVSARGPGALDPTGTGRARRGTSWKPAMNAFAIIFDGRID